MVPYSPGAEAASMGALFLPWRARTFPAEERDARAPWFDNFGTVGTAAPESAQRASRSRAWRERRPTDLTAQTSVSSSRSADAPPLTSPQTPPSPGVPPSPTFMGWRWPRMSSVDRRNGHAGSSLSVMRCFVPAPEPLQEAPLVALPLAAHGIDEDMRKALAE